MVAFIIFLAFFYEKLRVFEKKAYFCVLKKSKNLLNFYKNKLFFLTKNIKNNKTQPKSWAKKAQKEK